MMKKSCLLLLILWCLLIALPSIVWYTQVPKEKHKHLNLLPPNLNALMPNLTATTTENAQKEILISNTTISLSNFCNLPGRAKPGSFEGKFQDDHTLVGVITIFRHGDRGPLAQLKTRTRVNCSAYATDAYKKFENAVRVYVSKVLEDKLLPKSDFCIPGLLTKQGCSQLLELGQILNSSYVQHFKFSNSSDFSNINAFTTPYSRTIQSMYSLLFGMLGPSSLLRVKIQSRSQVSFCFKHCRCPATDQLEKLHKKEIVERVSHDTFFIKNFSEPIRPLQRSMEKPSKTELPSTVRDITLLYVCHNLSFPWFDSGESKPNSFRPENLLEALKREALVSSSGINLKKAAILRSYGLFTFLSQKIESWISKSKNLHSFRPMFLFMSGHDLTLMYILVALGIYDGYLPYYASRVTFEILQHERKYYARILWNGNDVTNTICVQETYAYCDARFLTSLLDSSLELYFGTHNFWEACEV